MLSSVNAPSPPHPKGFLLEPAGLLSLTGRFQTNVPSSYPQLSLVLGGQRSAPLAGTPGEGGPGWRLQGGRNQVTWAPSFPTSKLGGIRAPNPKAENLLSLEERPPSHRVPGSPGGGRGGVALDDSDSSVPPPRDPAQALLEP